VAESAAGQSISFDQTVLLSDRAALEDFIDAVYKVSEHIGELKEEQ
jgi:hypothetical protein